jgi:integrase
MDKRAWPTGISPSGRGLRVRIWRNRQLIYTETLACDPHSKSSITAAVKHRDALISRLNLGLPLFAGDETARTVTVAEAAQDYLNTIEVKRTSSVSYENILNQYWLPAIGQWPIAEVTTQEIKRVLASLSRIQKTPVAAERSGKRHAPPAVKIPLRRKTKKNILIPLRGVLAYAGINPNPADAVQFKKEQKDKVHRYTPAEREALLNATRGDAKAYFAVLLGCGLRPCGEPLALLWTDYDGKHFDISKQMTKRALEQSTKTSVRRRVYVPTWVRKYVNNLPSRFNKTGPIFVNKNGDPHLDADTYNAEWKRAHEVCGIPYRTPYVCRHTRAAELLSTGVSPAEAAKQLGHSLEMFIRTYAEFIEEFSSNQDDSRFEGLQPAAKLLPNTDEGN